MGYANGLIGCQRFSVQGMEKSASQEMLDALAKHAFQQPKEGIPNQSDYGWCGPEHINDFDFTFENCVFNGCLHIAMRVDTCKCPPEVIKSLYKQEHAKLAGSNPSGFISKLQKRELKETVSRKIDEERASGKHRRSKLIHILIDLENGILYGPTSPKAVEQLTDLMERTFDAQIIRRGSGWLAAQWCKEHKKSTDLRPTAFTAPPMGGEMWPEYGWTVKGGEMADFFGNEWLLWMWNKSETDGAFKIDGGNAAVIMMGGIKLECAFGYGGRDTMNGEIGNLPESRTALRAGKVPREAGICMEMAETFNLKLKCETLAVGALKLPEVEGDTPRQVFEERIVWLREFSRRLDSIFTEFCKVRFSVQWDEEVKQIQKWIAGNHRGGTENAESSSLEGPSNEKLMKIAPLAADLLQRRDDIRTLLGERYPEEILRCQVLIKDVMRKEKMEALPAAMKLIKDIGGDKPILSDADKVTVGTIIAAATELIDKQLANDPGIAKAVKKLVSGVGKGGITGISIKTTINGETKTMTFDGSNVDRVRKNCDAVIKGEKLGGKDEGGGMRDEENPKSEIPNPQSDDSPADRRLPTADSELIFTCPDRAKLWIKGIGDQWGHHYEMTVGKQRFSSVWSTESADRVETILAALDEMEEKVTEMGGAAAPAHKKHATEILGDLARMCRKVKKDSRRSAVGSRQDKPKNQKSPHTARDGDPKSASRGAAVVRAKDELIAALKTRLQSVGIKESHENRIRLLDHIVGEDSTKRLLCATLAELDAWTAKLGLMDTAMVQELFEEQKV